MRNFLLFVFLAFSAELFASQLSGLVRWAPNSEVKIEKYNEYFLNSVSNVTITNTNDTGFFNLTFEELSSGEAEVILQLEAYDETYSQHVHARTSYKYNEIVWGAKFIPILGYDGSYATLKMDDLGHYEKVDFKTQ